MSAEAVLAATGLALVTTDPSGIVVGWNAAAAALYGWTEAEALGRSVDELTMPTRARTSPVIGDVAAGRSWSGTIGAQHRSGRPLRIAVTTSPVLVDGEVVALVGTSRELRGQVPDDERVRRLSALVESSSDAIVALETDGTITSWNTAAGHVLGLSAEEAVGRSIYAVLPRGQREPMRAVLARVAVGDPVGWMLQTVRRPDGSTLVVDVTLSRILGAEGDVVGFSGIARDASTRVGLERSAEVDRVRLAQAQSLAHLGSGEIDLATGDVWLSAECWRILGLEPRERVDVADYLAALHPDDRLEVETALTGLRAGTVPAVQEFRVVRPGGEVRWVREASALDGRQPPRHALVTMHDVTDARVAETERRAAEADLRRGFERAATGMITTDLAGHVLTVNQAYLELVGRGRSELVGRRSAELMHPDDVERARTPRQAMIDGGDPSFHAEHRMLRADGSVVWVQKTVTLVRDDEGAPVFFTVQLQDISTRRALVAELTRRAGQDALTGLPTRELLVDRLEQALARVVTGDAEVSVVFVDVDEFKEVNDRLGHAAGDALLVQLAQRLQASVRPGDTISRFGGDEFVVVCEGIGGEEVAALGDRIHAIGATPFRLLGRDVAVTVSAGVATGSESATAQSLLHDADSAMYRAKQAGRGRTVVLGAAREAGAPAAGGRTADARELLRALEHGELEVLYQPVVDTVTTAVLGLDVRVRWRHPERGLLQPDVLGRLVEEVGLLPTVRSWVLHRATGQLARWRTGLVGADRLWLAVELCCRGLAEPGLVGTVRDALDAAGLPPDALRLELTEADVEHEPTRGVLRALRALGIRLTVDDLGTVLASLPELPVDTLRIGPTFVARLTTTAPERSAVGVLVGAASALGLAVVAAGVETVEQLAALRRLGVGTAQGHLWSLALTAPELARWWVERPGTWSALPGTSRVAT